MNTEETSREQISSLTDGELADRQFDLALAALREKTGRDAWDIYHQIGDVLRSDDMATTMSSGFAARMAARLEVEPTIIAPVIQEESQRFEPAKQVGHQVRSARQWRMPGMFAAAAMAAIAFIATPQLMGVFTGDDGDAGQAVTTASGTAASGNVESAAIQQVAASASAPNGVVLRDPRIDDYLLAHQRFSPSVYSAAQYARSATFATNSDK